MRIFRGRQRVARTVQSGFTLMEMLVVIGIVGILLTMGTYSYNTAQRNARDIQRQSDMVALQKGMEQHLVATGSYSCSESELMDSGALPAGFPVDPKTKIGVEFLTYLQQRLLEPLTSQQWVPQAYAQGYCAYCINTPTHQTLCTQSGGQVQVDLSCNSTLCCYMGGSGGGGTPSPLPSPVPSPIPSPIPSPSPTAPIDPEYLDDEQKYTLSNCSDISYCLCTRLERSGTGNSSSRNCTWQTNGNFYCLQQSQ